MTNDRAEGNEQAVPFNPYERAAGATMAWCAGVKTERWTHEMTSGDPQDPSVVSVITNGGWIGIANADFGDPGAADFTAVLSGSSKSGTLELRLDRPDGQRIGQLDFPESNKSGKWTELKTSVTGAQDEHDVYLVVSGTSDSVQIKLKE
ncbi:carbohydrate-binding protein [Paenibacillus sp. JX-17]|uniref:Carbohydrate-binding protein n=1 Tax=Paenibacillus lacisoli TaxID=3064525 RepID=A0ABT9CHM0_9BACL|nr:carbohydrate-binding protein [Paenibacillus sp. JX-17]MDO7908767.1 carbohydrate-binding protein [Paenibacillus sp. JX-17]